MTTTDRVTLPCGCKRLQIPEQPAIGFVTETCLEHAQPCKICKVALVRSSIVCDPCMAESGRPLRYQRAL